MKCGLFYIKQGNEGDPDKSPLGGVIMFHSART